MKDYQKYLNQIINNYYSKLEPIIKKIRNCRCQNCGGEFIDSNCIYCNSKNSELEQDINKINTLLNSFDQQISNLPIKEIYINKLFNLLYSIPNVEITCINNFLTKYNYQKDFYEFSKQTLSKLNQFDIHFDDLEINCLETLIYRNDKNFDLNFIYNYFINRCSRGKQNVSLESYKTIIKQFTEEILKPYYRNSECILTNYDKHIKDGKELIQCSGNNAHKIWISISDIENMYYNQNNDIIETIFHEVTHGIQYKNIFYGTQDIDPLVLLEIQDHILSKYLKNYYEDNYKYISFEIEAELYGTILASNFLNIDINNNHKMIDKITKLKEKLLLKKRSINGKESDINNIFNEFIYDHLELLKKHPQLTYLYKINQGKVVQLSQEEMFNNYQQMIDNKNLTEEKRKKYEQFYSQYINLTKKQSKPFI